MKRKIHPCLCLKTDKFVDIQRLLLDLMFPLTGQDVNPSKEMSLSGSTDSTGTPLLIAVVEGQHSYSPGMNYQRKETSISMLSRKFRRQTWYPLDAPTATVPFASVSL